jgi:CubicO group peptidase (beta-lactamase class C family)
MNDTYFFVPSEKANRIPAQYRKRAGALVQSRERGNEVPVSRFHSGAGGLRSSIHDYHRFARFLLNAGELDGVRLLKADMARRITTNQVGDNYPEAGLGWGMGVEVRTSTSAGSPQSVGAFGWGGGTGTQFLADPSSGLIAIVFVPTFPGTPGVSAARVAFIRAAYGASAP